MRLRAGIGVAGVWLVACATGTEPPELLGSLGGQAGSETAGTGAASGAGAQAGMATMAGRSGTSGAGSGGTPNGSGGSLGGGGSGGAQGGAGAGNGGAGNGGGGTGGAGSGGTAGSAGAGGMPNQSKPKSISVSMTRNALAKHVPSTGGNPYDDACPANQVLIGFRSTIDSAYMDAGLRSIGGVCGTLSIGAAAPYNITTGAGGNLPEREAPTTGVETAMCPANQVIVGFSGKSAMYMEALSFRCAPLSVAGNAPNFTLQFGNATDSALVGDENTGTNFAAINCAAGQAAVSQVMNAAAAVDNFGLACAALTLVVQ